MPDATLAGGFLASAKRLVTPKAKKPTQANLRRCISTCYYSVFHALAKACADGLVGSTKSRRPNKAWVEVYRGLEHGPSKNACSQARGIAFPEDLKAFSDAFVQLQETRHLVDYDPLVRPTQADALFYIALAEECIDALKRVSSLDKKAFATWVLITSRGADNARKRARNGLERQVR